jgi:mannose/fructose/N-acetylgalactosamine-specific phosphotransferase system component IIB
LSTWFLVQLSFDIALILVLGLVLVRFSKRPKDDPRLSRGLQLLQSKIAVLEDLSDRTDVQVRQLTTLLSEKGKELQERIFQADHQINRIKESMRKSLEISEIFQDKIPHEEIIERKNTINYVKAAKMANAGHTFEEIAKVVDIPRSELELITKINKDQLMFAPDHLPEWAKDEQKVDFVEEDGAEEKKSLHEIKSMKEAFESVEISIEGLQRIDKQFKQAVTFVEQQETEEAAAPEPQQLPPIPTEPARKSSVIVKDDMMPVDFKKIDLV